MPLHCHCVCDQVNVQCNLHSQPLQMTSLWFRGLVSAWDIISTPFTPNVELHNDPIDVISVPSSAPNEPVWTLKSPCATVAFENEVTTVDQLMKSIFTSRGQQRAFGYRKVLAKHVEKSKSGSSTVKKQLADEYTWFTHEQVDSMVEKVAHGLLMKGVKKGDRVAILMETRYEWFLASQACFRIGATLCTLYSTLGMDSIVIALNELQSTHMVTSGEFLSKIDSLKSRLDHLNTIIVTENIVNNETEEWSVKSIEKMNLISLTSFFDDNAPQFEGEYERPDEDTIALIMYTSGSTGAPKGVMMSHRSLLAGIMVICRSCGNVLQIMDKNNTGEKMFISFLPLAHIFQFIGDMSFLNLGFAYGYASPSTLLSVSPGLAKGTVCDVQLLKPHYMPCVPILIDRIKMKIESTMQAKGLRDYFHFLLDYKQKWNRLGKATPLVDRFVISKIQAAFGGNLRGMVVGGAPLSPESKTFMTKAGFCIMEAYAATESVGFGVMDIPRSQCSTLGIGYPMCGAYIKLVDWSEGGYLVSDSPNPRGEIHIGSPSISLGYFKQPDKTADEYYEADGLRWWRSGDIAEMMSDGSLKVIDRKKDLIKLSRGEYVSLGRIESALKSCSLVANVCLYGAPGADFLVALIVPNESWLLEKGKKLDRINRNDEASEGDLMHLYNDEHIVQMALDEMRSFLKNAGGFTSLEIPAKIKLCSEPWTPESGLLTSALKIRRKQIVDFYNQSITQMYS